MVRLEIFFELLLFRGSPAQWEYGGGWCILSRFPFKTCSITDIMITDIMPITDIIPIPAGR
ncbi:hypothetical protein Q427_04590 [Halomonas sp. BC04]|nr:hypothetical protein Q427_04590 [Halomonas sp. BC04]